MDRACFHKFKANGSGKENSTNCLAFLSSHPTSRRQAVTVVSTPTEELGKDGTSKIEAVRNRDAWIAWHDVGRRPWVGPSFIDTVIPILGKGGYTIPFFPLTRGAFTRPLCLGNDGPSGEKLLQQCPVKASQKCYFVRGRKRTWEQEKLDHAADSTGMVEGHGVHRVAARHRKSMVGKLVDATSPNGRVDASKIHGSRVIGVEAIGKNLFYTFQNDAGRRTVMHIHFGMAGRFTIGKSPGREPKSTTRIQLVTREEAPLVAQLTAMTCVLGGEDLYKEKRELLGPDPLREDADKERFWSFIQRRPKRSIGYLLMDQAAIAGIGNIYRSEILFCAGIHPDKKAADITRAEFESLWNHSVELLQRGFQSGYIITINPDEADGPLAALKGGEKRYVYNRETCKRCHKQVLSWSISNRKVYACESCQQLDGKGQFPAEIAGRENDSHNTAEWLLGEEKATAGLSKGRARSREKHQKFEPNSAIAKDRTHPTARTGPLRRVKGMEADSVQQKPLKRGGRLGFRERKVKQNGAARKVQHVISAK